MDIESDKKRFFISGSYGSALKPEKIVQKRVTVKYIS